MSETFDLADVERVAAALETVELSDRDRAVLAEVFARAGRALAADAPDAEVQGYSLSWGFGDGSVRPGVQQTLGSSFMTSFASKYELNPQPLPP